MEKEARSRMQAWKTRDLKMRHQCDGCTMERRKCRNDIKRTV